MTSSVSAVSASPSLGINRQAGEVGAHLPQFEAVLFVSDLRTTLACFSVHSRDLSAHERLHRYDSIGSLITIHMAWTGTAPALKRR